MKPIGGPQKRSSDRLRSRGEELVSGNQLVVNLKVLIELLINFELNFKFNFDQIKYPSVSNDLSPLGQRGSRSHVLQIQL